MIAQQFDAEYIEIRVDQSDLARIMAGSSLTRTALRSEGKPIVINITVRELVPLEVTQGPK